MLSYSPEEYVVFEDRGEQGHRQVLICDEAVAPLQILCVPRLFVTGLLTEMGLDWHDIGHVSVEETKTRIRKMQPVLRAHAQQKFSKVGIRYLDWTEHLPDC